jgi:glycosyltransferase involved in cell wall biosynthesis
MISNPLVTVYIPTYNRRDLLQRAVNSVLDQDYDNIELIIVDDCSKDDTVEYLQSISEKPGIRYFVNHTNSGACASRNRAIEEARGEFITGLDDDDYFMANHISSFVATWTKKDSNTIALIANTIIRTSNSCHIFKKPWKIRRFDLVDGNVPGNQVFTHTERLRNIGGFERSMPILQDLECWLRLLDSENVTIDNVGNASYVADTSHPHERISDNWLLKREQALEVLKSKKLLTEEDLDIFLLNRDVQLGEKIDSSRFLKKVIRNPSLYNLRRTLRLMARYFLNRVKSRSND